MQSAVFKEVIKSTMKNSKSRVNATKISKAAKGSKSNHSSFSTTYKSQYSTRNNTSALSYDDGEISFLSKQGIHGKVLNKKQTKSEKKKRNNGEIPASSKGTKKTEHAFPKKCNARTVALRTKASQKKALGTKGEESGKEISLDTGAVVSGRKRRVASLDAAAKVCVLYESPIQKLVKISKNDKKASPTELKGLEARDSSGLSKKASKLRGKSAKTGDRVIVKNRSKKLSLQIETNSTGNAALKTDAVCSETTHPFVKKSKRASGARKKVVDAAAVPATLPRRMASLNAQAFMEISLEDDRKTASSQRAADERSLSTDESTRDYDEAQPDSPHSDALPDSALTTSSTLMTTVESSFADVKLSSSQSHNVVNVGMQIVGQPSKRTDHRKQKDSPAISKNSAGDVNIETKISVGQNIPKEDDQKPSPSHKHISKRKPVATTVSVLNNSSGTIQTNIGTVQAPLSADANSNGKTEPLSGQKKYARKKKQEALSTPPKTIACSQQQHVSNGVELLAEAAAAAENLPQLKADPQVSVAPHLPIPPQPIVTSVRLQHSGKVGPSIGPSIGPLGFYQPAGPLIQDQTRACLSGSGSSLMGASPRIGAHLIGGASLPVFSSAQSGAHCFLYNTRTLLLPGQMRPFISQTGQPTVSVHPPPPSDKGEDGKKPGGAGKRHAQIRPMTGSVGAAARCTTATKKEWSGPAQPHTTLAYMQQQQQHLPNRQQHQITAHHQAQFQLPNPRLQADTCVRANVPVMHPQPTLVAGATTSRFTVNTVAGPVQHHAVSSSPPKYRKQVRMNMLPGTMPQSAPQAAAQTAHFQAEKSGNNKPRTQYYRNVPYPSGGNQTRQPLPSVSKAFGFGKIPTTSVVSDPRAQPEAHAMKHVSKTPRQSVCTSHSHTLAQSHSLPLARAFSPLAPVYPSANSGQVRGQQYQQRFPATASLTGGGAMRRGVGLQSVPPPGMLSGTAWSHAVPHPVPHAAPVVSKVNSAHCVTVSTHARAIDSGIHHHVLTHQVSAHHPAAAPPASSSVGGGGEQKKRRRQSEPTARHGPHQGLHQAVHQALHQAPQAEPPAAAVSSTKMPSARASRPDDKALPQRKTPDKRSHSGERKSSSASKATKSDVTAKQTATWCWQGESEEKLLCKANESSPLKRRCYGAIRHKEGDIVRVRDCVLLKSGPSNKDLPYIAKISALYESSDGDMMMSLLWYYRPEQAELEKRPPYVAAELYASKHIDENNVACIEDKCYVLTPNEYSRYRKKQQKVKEHIPPSPVVVPPGEHGYSRRSQIPPKDADTELVFVCSRVYDFRQKRLIKNPF